MYLHLFHINHGWMGLEMLDTVKYSIHIIQCRLGLPTRPRISSMCLNIGSQLWMILLWSVVNILYIINIIVSFTNVHMQTQIFFAVLAIWTRQWILSPQDHWLAEWWNIGTGGHKKKINEDQDMTIIISYLSWLAKHPKTSQWIHCNLLIMDNWKMMSQKKQKDLTPLISIEKFIFEMWDSNISNGSRLTGWMLGLASTKGRSRHDWPKTSQLIHCNPVIMSKKKLKKKNQKDLIHLTPWISIQKYISEMWGSKSSNGSGLTGWMLELASTKNLKEDQLDQDWPKWPKLWLHHIRSPHPPCNNISVGNAQHFCG